MAYPLEMDSAHFTPPLSSLPVKAHASSLLLSGHEVLRPCCSHHPQPLLHYSYGWLMQTSFWMVPLLKFLSFSVASLSYWAGSLQIWQPALLSPELRSTFFLRKPSLSRHKLLIKEDQPLISLHLRWWQKLKTDRHTSTFSSGIRELGPISEARDITLRKPLAIWGFKWNADHKPHPLYSWRLSTSVALEASPPQSLLLLTSAFHYKPIGKSGYWLNSFQSICATHCR